MILVMSRQRMVLITMGLEGRCCSRRLRCAGRSCSLAFRRETGSVAERSDRAFCRTIRDTLRCLLDSLSVRMDDEALHAPGQLEATGLTRSQAIRLSLVETAARHRDEEALAAEAARLEADEDDRAEMLAVARIMESLRAAR